MPTYKSVEQYESEAVAEGDCLIHPAQEAYRRVYERRHGMPAKGQHVCHTCDRMHCINDSHHFFGSPRDNQQDAISKGRHINQVITAEQMRKRGAAISVALTGRRLSGATKLKISQANIGRSAPESTRTAARTRMLGPDNPIRGKFGEEHPRFGHRKAAV